MIQTRYHERPESTTLESYLRSRLKEKDILLMTHTVLGYPSFGDCYRVIGEMVEAGVDLMELQIPFSKPIADGPVIRRANQKAIAWGTTVSECLDFAAKAAEEFEIPFLAMTYHNVPFAYGIRDFVSAISKSGLPGAVIPDLSPEEGEDYWDSMKEHRLSPILVLTPDTGEARLKELSSIGRGFFYCAARKGVTGSPTRFTDHLAEYLRRCRRVTHLPLAVGFGVKEKADVDYLKGKADIAVMGTRILQLVESRGIGSVRPFIRNLL